VDAGGSGGAGAGAEIWSGGPASLKVWDLRAGRLLQSLDGAAPLAAVDPPAGAGTGGGTCVVCADPDCLQVGNRAQDTPPQQGQTPLGMTWELDTLCTKVSACGGGRRASPVTLHAWHRSVFCCGGRRSLKPIAYQPHDAHMSHWSRLFPPSRVVAAAGLLLCGVAA
jgi:hypothetical protein